MNRSWQAVAVALCAAATAGCGLGPGDGAGTAELTVTRNFGFEPMLRETAELRDSDTVLRVLDRSTEIDTRYGGGFVQSIDGLEGGTEDGRRTDWFFYVNGIESSRGSADYELRAGDRVWWDHHDWTTAMRSPAVVGSWPEPFAHGYDGERWTTTVDCRASAEVCGEVSRRLAGAGADLDDAVGGDPGSIGVVVGTWERLSDGDASLLASGPERSGVFARIESARGADRILLLDARGATARVLRRGSGLVAALRPGEGPPTWVVTGADEAGVSRAASLLGEPLRDRYAVAISGSSGGAGETIPVPVP